METHHALWGGWCFGTECGRITSLHSKLLHPNTGNSWAWAVFCTCSSMKVSDHCASFELKPAASRYPTSIGTTDGRPEERQGDFPRSVGGVAYSEGECVRDWHHSSSRQRYPAATGRTDVLIIAEQADFMGQQKGTSMDHAYVLIYDTEELGKSIYMLRSDHFFRW